MLHQTVQSWPRSSRIIMALVRLFRTEVRNNGADALGNAVAPMRCQTVGSPVAPPEAPQPRTHLPLRRAPGLHSCLGCKGRIGGWPMRCGRRCARGTIAGYSRGTPGGTPAKSGHRRRRWCAPAIGVRISHRVYARNVLTRMPYTRSLILLSVFCHPCSCSVTCDSTAIQIPIQATARTISGTHIHTATRRAQPPPASAPECKRTLPQPTSTPGWATPGPCAL